MRATSSTDCEAVDWATKFEPRRINLLVDVKDSPNTSEVQYVVLVLRFADTTRVSYPQILLPADLSVI
jgi:hypothetical protein